MKNAGAQDERPHGAGRHSRVKILIADDHPLFRQGLRQTIETDSSFEIVGESGDGPATVSSLRALQPNLCILDVNMPGLDGLGVVREIRAQGLQTEVIILTMYKEEDLFNTAMELGVSGYVVKESAVTEILEAIRMVAAGERYISPALAQLVLTRRAGAEALRREKPGLDRLTRAERRILKLIAEDNTSKEIAEKLALSPRTVENHRTNICAKLEVHGIHSLVKFAFENKARL